MLSKLKFFELLSDIFNFYYSFASRTFKNDTWSEEAVLALEKLGEKYVKCDMAKEIFAAIFRELERLYLRECLTSQTQK